jgi:SM-20-related protein
MQNIAPAATRDADPPAPAALQVRLDPAHDRQLIRSVFERTGRIHVPQILDHACAERIHRCLVEETPWQLHVNEGDRHYDVTDDRLEMFTPADRVMMLERVHANARRQFQCLYNNFPIHDARQLGQHASSYLMRVYEFLNGEDFLAFAREATGMREIAMVDAQATLFRPGHFLTEHDDRVGGKGRLAAYVLTFTPAWRADWGGILQFIDGDGHVAEGYTPTFNALNLFRVPQRHAVSFVAPFATEGRYSITGWLRTRG